MEYTFREIQLSDLSIIHQLFEAVHGRKALTKESIRSKYVSSDGTLRCLGYLAFSNVGTIAGMYLILLVELKSGKEIIIAAQSADTMSHPEHQGKGLFVKLAVKTYELAERNKVAVVFGFPNDNSYPGFSKKLGWTFPKNQYTGYSLFLNPLGKDHTIEANESEINRHRLPVHEFGSLRAPDVVKTLMYEYNEKNIICWYKITNGFIEVGEIDCVPAKVSVVSKLSFYLHLFSLIIKYNLKGIRFYGDIESLIVAKKVFPFMYVKEGTPYGFKVLNGSAVLEESMKKMRFTYVDYDTF